MILDLHELPDEGLSFERTIDLPDLQDEHGVALRVGQVLLRGFAVKGTRGVDLNGELRCSAELVCSRCLEPYRRELRVDFSLCVVPSPPVGDPGDLDPGTGEHQMELEDAAVFHARGGRPDLRIIASEQIYLNLPMKPVCRADCAGLCPTCGADRNRLECGCSDTEVDPRLAPLMGLREEHAKPKT